MLPRDLINLYKSLTKSILNVLIKRKEKKLRMEKKLYYTDYDFFLKKKSYSFSFFNLSIKPHQNQSGISKYY